MPPYSQPKIPTPTKLRNEITELKNNIAEQEEVLRSHQKLFSEGTTSLTTMSPEVLSNISMMVFSESESLNSKQSRLSMLEEQLAKAEQAMELRAKRMPSLFSLYLM